jgi:DNA modification methylase
MHDRHNAQGRFPANLIHDGSDEVVECFPNNAARFFYCAKASRAERNAGCEGLPERSGGSNAKGYTQDIANGLDRNRPTTNHHPTVKPIALMRYLIKLVTPPNGTVLDPFLGSGTTAIAAVLEGFDWIGIEREAEYCEIAVKRIETELNQTDIFREES